MARSFLFVFLCGSFISRSNQQQCVNTTLAREKKQQSCGCFPPRRQRPSYQFLLNAWRQNMMDRERRSTDCDEHFLNGERMSGMFTINVGGGNMEVFCDFQYEGHNWVIIQRRADANLEFDVNWQMYQQGFGEPTTNYWLGLNAIHKLSLSLRRPVLRIDVTDATDSAYAQYCIFRVASEQRRYRLRIGGYTGTAGDGMAYHNGASFSTVDNDNDEDHFGRNCAMLYGGGWWFRDCLTANLNGRHGRTAAQRDGIVWYFWKTNFDSLSTTVMRVRAGS